MPASEMGRAVGGVENFPENLPRENLSLAATISHLATLHDNLNGSDQV